MDPSFLLQYSFLHWSLFFSASFLLALSPGPDIMFILGCTIQGGSRAGFAAMFGIWAGTVVHIILAIIGLSAIIANAPVAFYSVKWIGVIYLLWLGICAIRAQATKLTDDHSKNSAASNEIFFQGAIITLFNPKVAIFFFAFLPQFIVDGAGPIWFQLLLHGVLLIGVSAIIEPVFVFLGAKLTEKLRNSPQVNLWLGRCLGILFIALAARLALETI